MSPEIKHSEGCGKDNKVFVPLLERVIYVAQITVGDTTETNFVDKKVYDEFKNCNARHKLLMFDDVLEYLQEFEKKIISQRDKFKAINTTCAQEIAYEYDLTLNWIKEILGVVRGKRK